MTNHTLPTIAAGVHATKSIATCSRLLALAGLEQVLQGEGPYTLFAPTDGAFDALPPGALKELESDPAELRAMLEYHIITIGLELGEIRNGKLTTLQGALITSTVTDDGLQLDNANTRGYPMRCANGVIHQIDKVLFPGFTPASTATLKDSPWSGRPRGARFATTLPSTAVQAAEAMFNSTPGSA